MATKTRKPRKVDLRKLWIDVNTNHKNPPKDETVWLDDPLIAFLFAKYHRHKRWDEKQETCFYGNVKALYNYVLWVVRDLGLELPEHLNNYMIAKSLEVSDESSDKEWVDLYFKNLVNKKKKPRK